MMVVIQNFIYTKMEVIILNSIKDATPSVFDVKTTSLEISTEGLTISGRDSSTSSNNQIRLGSQVIVIQVR